MSSMSFNTSITSIDYVTMMLLFYEQFDFDRLVLNRERKMIVHYSILLFSPDY